MIHYLNRMISYSLLQALMHRNTIYIVIAVCSLFSSISWATDSTQLRRQTGTTATTSANPITYVLDTGSGIYQECVGGAPQPTSIGGNLNIHGPEYCYFKTQGRCEAGYGPVVKVGFRVTGMVGYWGTCQQGDTKLSIKNIACIPSGYQVNMEDAYQKVHSVHTSLKHLDMPPYTYNQQCDDYPYQEVIIYYVVYCDPSVPPPPGC